MNGDAAIIFKHRITQFCSHEGNVSFSKRFHQQVICDKWDKCLKLQEVEKIRNLIR